LESAVARRLREELLAREADLDPSERVALAFALGERDLRVYAAAQGLTLREAWRRLRRANQAGRTPSRAASYDDP
jgi:hypothetical protein